MKGVNEKLVRRVADRAEAAWKAGTWVPYFGFRWSASNPVDDWHNLSAINKAGVRSIVAVYQRKEGGEIRNLSVLE